ncbi:MAG TPA: cytochrome c peroxidase [Usitatibacter sp.]|jgi:cytochrome c peroxidase|nr:cytochrome c peroxidase [Usitatibacter sp.]
MGAAPLRLAGAICAVAAAALCAACGSGGSAAPPLPDDEAKLSRLELIGKRIFFDVTLSNPPGQSCAGCHDSATAFAGNFGSSAGVPFAANGTTLGLRNTPTAMYASFTPAFSLAASGARLVASGGQFLDGRAAGLEEQAAIPFFSAGEMNISDPVELAGRLARGPYVALLVGEFGFGVFSDGLVVEHAAKAIAAFERTVEFAPFSSKFDASLHGAAALTDLEMEGQRLFADPQKGNCASCHAFNPATRHPAELVFTDFTYHNLGVPRNMRIPSNADPAFFDLGLCGPRRAAPSDETLCGSFKVPTLRNAARKRAFMHNGFFTSLRDVVAFYATRDSNRVRWYGSAAQFDDVPANYRANVDLALVPFRPSAAVPVPLDEHEIDAITAFLGTLDDGYGPSHAPALD